MRHLKNFDRINEEFDVPHSSAIYADSWEATKSERGDFDVIWADEQGNTVNATFEDAGDLMKEGDGTAHSRFDSVPGSSSDGNDYVAEVLYKETKMPDDYVIVSMIIHKL
jgi:hypothetical protein